MALYNNELTQYEIKSILNDYFENKRTGRLVKLVWFLKNKPDQTKPLLQEIYGELPYYEDIHELIYNLYYPNCKKICDICGKPLDRFTIKYGYTGGVKHNLCKKKYNYEKFVSYQDLIGRHDLRKYVIIDKLSCRNDILPLIDTFRKDYPEFNHYTNYDCVYLLIMFDNLININSKVPYCVCGNM